MKKTLKLMMLGLALFCGFSAQAQIAAIKTNVLVDATATINLGVEVGMSKHWTFDISGNLNDWKVRNSQWKHWLVQPEFRYWFCERFQGNFIGIHGIGGQYSVGGIKHLKNFLGNDFAALADKQAKGYAAGVGICYGHTWILCKHINLEAEIGFGWAYTRYDQYDWVTKTKLKENVTHNYVGPTKLALNLEYVF